MLQNLSSVTHAHIVEVINAELAQRSTSPSGEVEILDVGCGTGKLMAAMHRYVQPPDDANVVIRGFDVSDARVQRSNFFDSTLRNLEAEAPEVAWGTRTSVVTSRDAWPASDESVDFAVTNQVLEHIADLDLFMQQLGRVLKPGGVSVNLFPVQALIIEGHTGIPFGHRWHSDDVRSFFMAAVARLGLARLGPMRKVSDQSSTDFGHSRAEYVATQTFYRSFKELSRAAHRRGLTASYRWTPHFYMLKLGYLLGINTSGLYRHGAVSRILEALTFAPLSRLSSVSIIFRKDETYDPDSPHAGHLG